MQSPIALIAGSLLRPSWSTSTPSRHSSPASAARVCLGDDADADQRQIARHEAPVCELDGVDLSGAVKCRHRRTQLDRDAARPGVAGNELRQLARGDARHQARLALDHDDLGSELARRRGRLEPDVAAADDRDPQPGADRGAQRERVIGGAQRHHAGQRHAGNLERSQPRAGREDQVVVGQGLAAFEADVAAGPVDALDVAAGEQRDVAVGVIAVGLQPELGGGDLAEHQPLRQRWPLVGRVLFGAQRA